MSSAWDEVKRLAADLQKAQLSSSLQRLSERNCIEIVSHLIQNKYVDVIFTNDGKEYITPEHLIKEMQAELYVRGGRVNLVELSKCLHVDLNHISNYSKDIQKHNNVHFVLGQLIDTTYINRISSEINEKLIQNGKVSVNDLTLLYDLPADFLQRSVIEKQLGKLIQAKQDPNDTKLFYTDEFAARTKAKIRGALAALTKPTPVAAILNQCGLQDTTFYLLYDQIVTAGSITSRQSGAQYIPHIYSRSQAEWVSNFYKQNMYLDFDALARLGVGDGKGYIKRQFPNEDLTTLDSCVVSRALVDQVDGAIEECITSKSCVDVQSLLPSVFTDKDMEMIIEATMTPSRKKLTLIFGYCVLSTAYIEALNAPCEALCTERAKVAVESGKYQQFLAEKQISSRSSAVEHSIGDADSKFDKREERRKKASGGKSGGGAQGRETKTKSTKKHYRANKNIENDSDEELHRTKKHNTVLELISVKDIEEMIENQLEDDGISDLVTEIATYLQLQLNTKALEKALVLHANSTANNASVRRQTHTALQERLNALLSDVRLFEKGSKFFTGEIQSQLEKYLLKSVCTDIVNDILVYVATEYELNLNNVSNPLTHENRMKISNEAPQEFKGKLQLLLKTLAGSSIEEFLNAAEDCLPACSMILKKIDKKKDRLLILNHKHGLIDQLQQCEDPALVLHLCSLIIFAASTQNMLHASGRHVFAIIMYLKQFLSTDEFSALSGYHDLVTQYLNSDNKQNIGNELNNKMDGIKKIAINYKKAPAAAK